MLRCARKSCDVFMRGRFRSSNLTAFHQFFEISFPASIINPLTSPPIWIAILNVVYSPKYYSEYTELSILSILYNHSRDVSNMKVVFRYVMINHVIITITSFSESLISYRVHISAAISKLECLKLHEKFSRPIF